MRAILENTVIHSFADDTARDIWNGINSRAARRIPQPLWAVVRRKLDQLDAVTRLDDLRVPPGNRLHALTDRGTDSYARRRGRLFRQNKNVLDARQTAPLHQGKNLELSQIEWLDLFHAKILSSIGCTFR